MTWAGAAVPARGISPKGPPRTTPTGTRERPFDVRRSGRRDRAAVCHTRFLISPDDNGIQDRRRRSSCPHNTTRDTALHTDRSPLVVAARRSSLGTSARRSEKIINILFFFFFPSAYRIYIYSTVSPAVSSSPPSRGILLYRYRTRRQSLRDIRPVRVVPKKYSSSFLRWSVIASRRQSRPPHRTHPAAPPTRHYGAAGKRSIKN